MQFNKATPKEEEKTVDEKEKIVDKVVFNDFVYYF